MRGAREELASCGLALTAARKIALGSGVVAGAVRSVAGSSQSSGVLGIEAENFLILGECAGVVLGLREELPGPEMSSGIGRQGRGEGHEFGFCFVGSVLLEQELDEFNASFAAVGVGVGVPDSVHGIVVVTSGIFDRAAVGGDAGESEIDSGVLRSALPESDEVGFGFVETAGIVAVAQGAGQAELVLGVGGIAG